MKYLGTFLVDRIHFKAFSMIKTISLVEVQWETWQVLDKAWEWVIKWVVKWANKWVVAKGGKIIILDNSK